MDKKDNVKPPGLFLTFFRWFCHPDYREDIEGDLLERFHDRTIKSGVGNARWFFIREVIFLLRPGIIKELKSFIHPKFLDMKKNRLIPLAGINVLFIIAIILPFIPGPPNKLVIGLSAFSQMTGFFGLALIPFGIVWTVLEIRKCRNNNLKNSNRKLTYYFAVAVTVIAALFCLLLIIAVIANEEALIGCALLIPLALGLRIAIKGIKKLKNSPGKFNLLPLYLLTIPLMSFLTRIYVVGPVSDYSRSFAIKRSEALIRSVEEYKNKKGQYPESIYDLERHYKRKIQSPLIMGILDFRYNKINDHYSISFSQWLQCGSLEEIVLYDKNNLRNNLFGRYAKYDYSLDLCRIKGALDMRDTIHDNWQYYLVD